MVSAEQMKVLLNEQKEDILREMNVKFTEIKMDLKQVKEIAVKAESQSSTNEASISQLKSDVAVLKAANEKLASQLDDQINRSMRNTLIFKVIKEEPNESWDETEKALCQVIARHLKMDVEAVEEMVERAHRGKPSAERRGPRNIYVKFYSWKDSESIKAGFSSLNMKHPKMAIRAEQMFSAELTSRRNTAMLERKKLIADKSISQCYLKYPAILMAKKSNNDKNYFKLKSF